MASWGATYPVAYEYDALGRMTAMATTRGTNDDFSAIAAQLQSGQSLESMGSTWSLDITKWRYDTATGLLTNKLYPAAGGAGADNNGPSYSYDPAGRLTQRTWARGIDTHYAYDVSVR